LAKIVVFSAAREKAQNFIRWLSFARRDWRECDADPMVVLEQYFLSVCGQSFEWSDLAVFDPA